LNFLPFRIPPPIPKINSRSVMPIGTSTNPVLTTLPTSEKIIVPDDFSVPMPAYHSAPFATMIGTLAQVLTLLMTVGIPHSPRVAG
jgi:hypothetical protein